jgi:hypothetical protein
VPEHQLPCPAKSVVAHHGEEAADEAGQTAKEADHPRYLCGATIKCKPGILATGAKPTSAPTKLRLGLLPHHLADLLGSYAYGPIQRHPSAGQ